MTTRTDFDVLMVTFNSAEHIRHQLDSLLADDAVRVTVVDNASTDTTVAVLKSRRCDQLSVVLNDENVGFARAVNIGLRSLIDRAPYTVLLNPDAQIDGSSLRILQQTLIDNPSVGIAAPVISYGGRAIEVMSAGKDPTAKALFLHYSGLSRRFPNARSMRGRHLFHSHHSSDDQTVDWVSGACMVIRTSLIEEIGPLSERWFMYAEDLEYCRRVRGAGYEVRVVANASAQHVVGGSTISSPVADKPEDARSDEARKISDLNRRRVDEAWALNTLDYFITYYQPSLISKALWLVSFEFGMLTRGMKYDLLAATKAAHSAENRQRARKFYVSGGAVARQTLRLRNGHD